MREQTPVSKPLYSLLPINIEGFDSLAELALDIAQAPARQVVSIENTPIFVQIAEGLGILSILHTDYRSTGAKPALFGLQNDEGVIHETS